MNRAAPLSVCVEVRAVRGSAPREAGARMLVSPSEMQGSIGGGSLEYVAIARARRLLASWAAEPETTAEQTEIRALGPQLGQCCGGSVVLAYSPWFEAALPRLAPLFHLQLHGAGHVGRALVGVLRQLPCTVDWVDSRADAFPPVPEEDCPALIRHRHAGNPVLAVSDAPAGSNFLVMTHSHPLDAAICEAALRRGDARYVGLIGSATKRARFESRWRACGLADPVIASLVCPIGLSEIAGKQPAVLALSVAAQLVQRATAIATAASPAIDEDGCGGCVASGHCRSS